MKLAIVGSRSFNDYGLLCNVIKEHYNIEEIECIVSGGAKGADKLAERFMVEHNKKDKIFMPDESIPDNSRYYQRNLKIVDYCDELIAFWDGKSKGTKLTTDICKQKKKPYILFNVVNNSQEMNNFETQQDPDTDHSVKKRKASEMGQNKQSSNKKPKTIVLNQNKNNKDDGKKCPEPKQSNIRKYFVNKK